MRLLLLPFILIFFSAYSQDLPAKMIAALKTTDSFDAFKNDSSVVAEQFGKNTVSAEDELELKHYVIAFRKDQVTGSRNVNDTLYRIHLKLSGDLIVSKQVTEVTYGDDGTDSREKELFLDYNENELLRKIEKHNQIYQSEKTLANYLTAENEFGSFSYSCGWGGGITDDAIKLGSFITYKNQYVLGEMAASFEASERAWATAGLYILSLKGVKLTSLNLKRMAINRNSENGISTCQGCLITTGIMKDLLTDEALLNMYSFLKTNKVVL